MISSLKTKHRVWIWLTTMSIPLFCLVSTSLLASGAQIPLYGLFETTINNSKSYNNPFTNVELNAKFTSPTGRVVNFFGFYDGNGNGGQTGKVWKQRFMPDEVGTWRYDLKFSDGSPGKKGSFDCVSQGAKPGPWRQNPINPRWFKTANGKHFFPVAMHANSFYTPKDWQDAISWSKAKGYNTIISATFNTTNWGDGWGNVTAFATLRGEPHKQVDYTRMNLKMWHEWDDMIQAAAEQDIYIGPFQGPSGKYGGQERGKYPPAELAFFPGMRDRFNTSRNLKIIRYLIARQGAFWNIAYWSLGSTEIYRYAVENKQEFLEYGEYIAAITPWDRMITGQDTEQWHTINRRWMTALNIPKARKLNTVQSAVASDQFTNWGASSIKNEYWVNARPNNELANDSYGGFPVLGTETLWEGQPRATRPLRIIWGFLTAGAHTMWADWSWDTGQADGRWHSIGRGWIPVKPLSEHIFRTNQLGVNTVGDEQLAIAVDALKQLNYWKMSPHNELVERSSEAYCLAEPGKQYLIYAPRGGAVKIDLSGTTKIFEAKWLDPRLGGYSDFSQIDGGAIRVLNAPTAADWVLVITLGKSTVPENPTSVVAQ